MGTAKQHIVLEAKNLEIGYKHKSKKTIIAKDVNFKLNAGELVAVIGVNGIGKSTLLQTLANMQPKLSGRLLLQQEDMSVYSDAMLSEKIGVVLTEPLASQNLSILEMVSLGRQPYTNWLGNISEIDKEAINNALKQTTTEHLQHKKCYELSDGQLQRANIARALAQDTPIIMLDEPTTHLDLYHSAYVLKMLKRLSSEKNKTILFATHEINLALQMAHKLVILTKTEAHFDTPETLIKKGILASLFPKDTVVFNGLKKQFEIV